MRQLAIVAISLGLAGNAFGADSSFGKPFAKFQPVSRAAPGCVTPVGPACAAPGHPTQCGCQPCAPPCKEGPPPPKEGPPPTKEAPPQLEYLPKEMGAYVAPPRVGTTRGAMVQRGIEGAAITFPEFKFRLPSIELPARYASRTQARMHLEGGIAPWESHGFVNAAAGTNEALLLRRIAELEKSLEAKTAPAPKSVESAADRAALEKSAAEDYARKLAEYQQLLEQCERQQEQLRACIRQCLEQHPGGAAPLPGAEGHPKGLPSPIQKPSPDGYEGSSSDLRYGPKPQVDPSVGALPAHLPQRPTSYVNEPYLAPNASPQQVSPPANSFRYVEQPAAYVSEPARLPPQRHWITEPRPEGRITGLRPVTR